MTAFGFVVGKLHGYATDRNGRDSCPLHCSIDRALCAMNGHWPELSWGQLLLPPDRTHLAGLVVLHRGYQFVMSVHYKWAMTGDWLPQRLACQQEEAAST
jgi:hypothetical protein